MTTRTLLLALVAASIAALAVSPAEAKHRKHARHQQQTISNIGCVPDNNGKMACGADNTDTVSATRVVDASANRAYASAPQDGTTIIGGRPAGCPHRYCGCGLARYLGIKDVRLNLASNWARLFRRETAPRAGLAAVRPGHVMYIEAAAGNGQWLIRDYNSGGGLSRLHVRDVRGYVFVDPHASTHT